MNIGNPNGAPARPDLVFLRRRTRPKVGSTSTPHPVPATGPRTSVPVDRLLDLSVPDDKPLDVSASSIAPSTSPRDTSMPPRVRPGRRVRAGERITLTLQTPTVTLTRPQSGVGILTVEAACTDAVGDLRLGCAYSLRSGVSSILAPAAGGVTAPPQATTPVIWGVNDSRGTFTIDLRQCRNLDRLIIYGFSDSGSQVPWSGTLITTTFASGRIEIPLDRMPAGSLGVVMSLYNVHGEFVLRAEMCPIDGSVQDACHAFGFDSITWMDGRTPLD